MSSHVLAPFRWLWRRAKALLTPAQEDDGVTIGGIATASMTPAMTDNVISQAEYQNAFMRAVQDKSNRQANPQRYVEPVFNWTEIRYDPKRGLVSKRVTRAVAGRCSLCGAAVPGPDFRCSEHCLNGRA